MGLQHIAGIFWGDGLWMDFPRHLRDLFIAFMLAFPIGWERERAARSAGVRTFPLASMASCGLVLLAKQVLGSDADAQSRLLQGLIPGIGFLGAGAIVKNGGEAHGITTAVSIWTIGTIGAAVGYGVYDIAAILSGTTDVTLRFLMPIKRNLQGASDRPEGPAGGGSGRTPPPSNNQED